MNASSQAVLLLDAQFGSDAIDWNVVRGLLERHPGASSSLRFHNGFNILHFVCEKKAPLRVVKLLVRQHRNAPKEKNNFGNLPLHVVCDHMQSCGVVDFLVQKRTPAGAQGKEQQ